MIYNSTDHQGERWSWKLQGGKEIAVPHYSSVAISCFSNILSFLDLADAVRERVSEWPILCAATQSNVSVSSLGWSLWRNRPSAAPLQDINHVEMCVWMCLDRSRLSGSGKKTNSLSITPLTWTGNVLLSCCRADCQSTFHASPTRPVTAKFFLTKHSVCYRHKYNPLSLFPNCLNPTSNMNVLFWTDPQSKTDGNHCWNNRFWSSVPSFIFNILALSFILLIKHNRIETSVNVLCPQSIPACQLWYISPINIKTG